MAVGICTLLILLDVCSYHSPLFKVATIEISNTKKSHMEARVNLGGTYISFPGADVLINLVGVFETMPKTETSQVHSELKDMIHQFYN